MARSQPAYRPARRRSTWLLGLLLSGLGVVFLRLCYLQVYRHEYYITEGADLLRPGRAQQRLAAPGAILCRNGEPLAESVELHHIIADPARMVGNGESFQVIAEQLSPLIHRSATDICSDLQSDPKRSYKPLLQWAKRDTVKAVLDYAARGKIEGLWAEQVWLRQYPMGQAAAHLLGGRDRSHHPLGGLEYQYRLVLDSLPAAGAAPQPAGLSGLDTAQASVAPVPGKNLVLTLNAALQSQVEAEMDGLAKRETPDWASCVIMDPRSGEVLAMSTRPGYDPNDYLTGTPPPGRWSSISAAVTRNRPVADALEQGSTFKVILAAAALSSGKISPGRRFNCSGHLGLGGQPISCWGKYAAQGHGSLDMAGMLANSCNICAGQTALAMGRRSYRGFLAQCGINQDPQAGFPGEAFGRLSRLDNIRPRDLATMAFGQNVSCSSLQLAAIVAGLVNGGQMMHPHIVGAVVNKDGSLFRQVKPHVERTVCTPEVSRQLLTMLEGVVVNGTGKAAAIPGLRVGGKTGTAQKWDPVRKKHTDRYMVSFIMVFPIEQPRYVIHVACDEPDRGRHGADVAAPVCKRLGQFIMQQIDRSPPAAS